MNSDEPEMVKRIKILYIVGDGRSGSTLLESILNNCNDSISIGEGYRFWERFYKSDSHCGCGISILNCPLWSVVHKKLRSNIKNYDYRRIIKDYRKWFLFKNYKGINKSKGRDLQYLLNCIKEFYMAISEVSGMDVVIDSSKNPTWGKFLALVPEFEVYFIHLERKLPDVAASWKKKVVLPEYTAKKIYMPIKSDLNILRTWLRVKYLSHKLKKYNYLFIRYSNICKDPQVMIKRIEAFAHVDCRPPWINRMNHGIAGNPMREKNGQEIVITEKSKTSGTLSLSRVKFFQFVDFLSNKLF